MEPAKEEEQKPAQEQSTANDKELNFRNLQNRYERELSKERAARAQAEKVAEELMKKESSKDDDDSTDEPYVDHKRLEKKLKKTKQETKQETRVEVEQLVQQALYKERKENWLKQNPDFYEILSDKNATKFIQKAPHLAENLLKMPEGFERDQLVYNTIKVLGLDRPEEPSIQDKINSNSKSPSYQPGGMGSSPTSLQGDFSPKGQQQAYEKMQELKNRLRIS